MSWWSTSWLPALPSIDFSLPAGIQKRFISFALRQALGHLLKPGQLDVQQVDSQIGSGFVQVRDVELDNDAINSLIAGLPIQLHDGTVGKVTARIPWPNPLKSTLGLSLEGLHLTFNLSPTVSNEHPINLAESVASVAETFLHEELNSGEEAVLRESIYSEVGASNSSLDHIPGGINPFLSDEEIRTETNPEGVSLFATLVERLLSRFELNATDIRITIVNPGDASFTLIVPSVRYGTEYKAPNASPPSSSSQPVEIHVPGVEGATRTLTISGVTVTTRCLRPPSPQLLNTSLPRATQGVQISQSPPATVPPESPPHSPALSDSDMDEEAYMQMSQAIVGLPPRPPSPTSSVASSMYESAVSYGTPPNLPVGEAVDSSGPQPSTSPLPPSSPPHFPTETVTANQQKEEDTHNEIEDETILSLGSEPIVIHLVTPPLRRATQKAGNAGSEKGKEKGKDSARSSDSIKLDASIGVVAFALRARHVCSLAEVAQLWASHTPLPPAAPKPPQTPEGPSSSILDRVEASLQVRGVVFLFLPARGSSPNHPDDPLVEYFSRPLVPPHLPHGFVRIHLESLSLRAALRSTYPSDSRSRRTTQPSKTITATLSLSDLSAFAFLANKKSNGLVELSASPILITDPNLSSQYPTQHIYSDLRRSDPQMPIFDIIDWTDPARRTASAKLSVWRIRPSHNRNSSNPDSPITSPYLPLSSPPRPTPVNLPSSPGRLGLLGTSGSPRVGEAMTRPHQSAMIVKITVTTPPTKGKSPRGSASQGRSEIGVEVAPLHIFCDLGLALEGADSTKSETLQFFDELSLLSSPKTSPDALAVSDSEEYDPEEEGDTPPGTPQAQAALSQRNQERERKRLEQMVLDDLDLGIDYLGGTPKAHSATKVESWQKKQPKLKKGSDTSITVKVPMIRIQMRCTPPPSRKPRSGAIILDIHDLSLIPGESPLPASGPSARFDDPGDNMFSTQDTSERREPGATLVNAEWARLVIAASLVGENKALAIISTGGLQGQTTSTQEYPSSPPLRTRPATLSKQRVTVNQSSSRPSGISSGLKTLAITVDIPSVLVKLSKPHFDGLQFFADDAQQLVERTVGSATQWDSDTERADSSRNTSLIGSRFFTKTRRSIESEASSSFGLVSVEKSNTNSETVIKVTIYEAAARLALPREDSKSIRPFDILASGVDVLLEIKPEGQDETVVTVGVDDLSVIETSKSNSSLTFLGLTVPRVVSNSVQSLLKLRFTSFTVPGTNAKETWIKVTLCGVTYSMFPDLGWISDIGLFAKAPPGVFESVVPSERTRVNLKVIDSSLRALAPKHKGAMVLHLGEIDFSTVAVGNLPETSFYLGVQSLGLFMVDDLGDVIEEYASMSDVRPSSRISRMFGAHWRAAGYALLLELGNFKFDFVQKTIPAPSTTIVIDRGDLRLHLCADTGAALGAFISDLTSLFSSPTDPNELKTKSRRELVATIDHERRENLLASVDEHAFSHMIPQVGADPEVINDNIPRNPDYLDDFSASAGLRELDDDEDFNSDEDTHYTSQSLQDDADIVSKHGGETIRLINRQALDIIENYFETLPPDSADESTQYGETTFKLRIHNGNVTVMLYDGYDWPRTRRIIEEEKREMRRRLAKIRQLVATGQTPDPSIEETNRLLFNSVYIGLEHDVDELEPAALIQAIDEELNDDFETTSLQSSWQSLKPQQMSPGSPETRPKRSKKKLTRSKGPSIEFSLMGLDVEVDNYREHKTLASRTLVAIKDAEILDHIKTSTWSKFLTSLRADSKGNIRETGSNMVRVELKKVYPVEGDPAEEARLRAKLLPLRLHVDQDALDFLKKFFAFKDPEATPSEPTDPVDEIYFQQVEVFPVDIKLDYKPRRVDYRALREGRTIELMNFFHFDGAEMTLRHITLTGVSGWARVGDLLNDLWTPDVKATQLVEVISGVAPIRSVVNVGSGVADLVLLPIAQYKKDGRVVHGLQKGTKAFVQSTATEAIKLGARLATGTQVILEQTEHVLGGQFGDSVTAEAVQIPEGELDELVGDPGDMDDLISRYADQPTNVKEGVRFAYKSLRRNFNSAAQTILAVPMEVYERSGNEGAVRAVVRAVPIAVLKPMIGATEAISKTLLGLHNSLDPNVRAENELKYKKR